LINYDIQRLLCFGVHKRRCHGRATAKGDYGSQTQSKDSEKRSAP